MPVDAGKRHPIQTRMRRPGLRPPRAVPDAGNGRRPHALTLSAARLLADGKPPYGAELHALTLSAARLLADGKPPCGAELRWADLRFGGIWGWRGRADYGEEEQARHYPDQRAGVRNCCNPAPCGRAFPGGRSWRASRTSTCVGLGGSGNPACGSGPELRSRAPDFGYDGIRREDASGHNDQEHDHRAAP